MINMITDKNITDLFIYTIFSRYYQRPSGKCSSFIPIESEFEDAAIDRRREKNTRQG